jgi:hypothetical protein
MPVLTIGVFTDPGKRIRTAAPGYQLAHLQQLLEGLGHALRSRIFVVPASRGRSTAAV